MFTSFSCFFFVYENVLCFIFLFHFDHTWRSQLGMVTANELLKINTVFKSSSHSLFQTQLAAYTHVLVWHSYDGDENTEANVRLQYHGSQNTSRKGMNHATLHMKHRRTAIHNFVLDFEC